VYPLVIIERAIKTDTRRFLMGVFTYVYYSSLIREHHVTVGSILQTIVSGLTVDEQLELMMDLRRYLEGQGIKAP
jgi:phosphatidate cytidylyltransferase